MAVLIVEVRFLLALSDTQRITAGEGEPNGRRVNDGAPGRRRGRGERPPPAQAEEAGGARGGGDDRARREGRRRRRWVAVLAVVVAAGEEEEVVEREGRGEAPGRGGGGGEEAEGGGGGEGAAHLGMPAPPVVLLLPRAGRSFHSREGIEEGGGE